MDCPRNFTKEQIITSLKSGRVLIMDRIDAPELEDLQELENQGLVTSTFAYAGSQGSVLKWNWKS